MTFNVKYHYEPATEITRGLRSGTTEVVQSKMQVSIGVPLLEDFSAWAIDVERLAHLHDVALMPKYYYANDVWAQRMIDGYTRSYNSLVQLIQSYSSCKVTQAQHAKRMSTNITRMLWLVDAVRKSDHALGKKIYGKPTSVSEFPL